MRSTMSIMRVLRNFIPYVVAAIALGGSQSFAQQNENSVSTEFVRVDGLHFAAGNERFYFLGTNNYYLHQFALSTSGQQQVLEVLDKASLLGLTVIRTWAFSEKFGNNALQPGPYQLNENVAQALDWVIYQAGLRGIRTILTLTDNWPDYGGIEYYIPWSPTAQSRNDFFTDPIIKDIYKTYFFNIATRVNSITNVEYRNDPRIFCWELINEPRIPGDSTGDVLQAWIEEMASYVKSIDSNHMLSVGQEGFFGASNLNYVQFNPGGWANNEGSDFIRNHLPDTIDFASAHVWVNAWLGNSGSLSTSEKVNWVVNSWLAGHIQASDQILGKPFLLGEYGLPQPLSERDQLYQGIFNTFANEALEDGSGAGSLFWLLQNDAYPDFDGNAVYIPAHSSTQALMTAHSSFMNSYKPLIESIPSPPPMPPQPPRPPSPPFVEPVPPELGSPLFENQIADDWTDSSWEGDFSLKPSLTGTNALRASTFFWGAFSLTTNTPPLTFNEDAFSRSVYGAKGPVAVSFWMYIPGEASNKVIQMGLFASSSPNLEWSTFAWSPASAISSSTSDKSIAEVSSDLSTSWVHFMVDISSAILSGVAWNRIYFKGYSETGMLFYLDRIWLVPSDIEIDPKLIPFATPDPLAEFSTLSVDSSTPPAISPVSARLLTPPLTVMPMGDSITAGFPIPGGYREKLHQNLIDLSLQPDMQGSLTVNCGSVLQDCNHEGHGGWRIDTMANALPQFLPLPATSGTDPDVILLMLGTNDMGQEYFVSTAPQRLLDLIIDIRNRRPEAVVLVATIPPFSTSFNNINFVEPYNQQIINYVVPFFQSPQVRAVDIYSQLDPSIDLIDSVHPNKQGADKIADIWTAAIIDTLAEFTPAPPPPLSLPPPPSPPSPSPSPPSFPPPSMPVLLACAPLDSSFPPPEPMIYMVPPGSETDLPPAPAPPGPETGLSPALVPPGSETGLPPAPIPPGPETGLPPALVPPGPETGLPPAPIPPGAETGLPPALVPPGSETVLPPAPVPPGPETGFPPAPVPQMEGVVEESVSAPTPAPVPAEKGSNTGSEVPDNSSDADEVEEEAEEEIEDEAEEDVDEIEEEEEEVQEQH